MRGRKWMLGWIGLLLLAGCGSPAGGAFSITGFIEAEEISLAPEVGGRVVALPVAVGEAVESGQVLIRLDDRVARAQVALAEAQVSEAEARLALVRDGATSAEIQVVEGQVLQAEAGRSGACQAWKDAQAILKNPQEINRQISVVEAQLRAAEAGRNAADALRQAAGIGVVQLGEAQDAISKLPDQVGIYSGPIGQAANRVPSEVMAFLQQGPADGTYTVGDYNVSISGGNVSVSKKVIAFLPIEAHLAPNYYWKATIGFNSAQIGYEGLQKTLDLLYAMRSNPRQARSQVDLAAARCREAEAGEEAARAALDALRQGATREELAALEAALEQARAALGQAQANLEKQVLTAPSAGVVLEQGVELGELAVPQVALITLADLDVMRMTAYLPNADLGKVTVGQRVSVQVDNFPDRTFPGEVVFIGSEAEFPPQDVPRQDEREALAFAVRIRIPNPEHLLKPGMPADVIWGAE